MNHLLFISSSWMSVNLIISFLIHILINFFILVESSQNALMISLYNYSLLIFIYIEFTVYCTVCNYICRPTYTMHLEIYYDNVLSFSFHLFCNENVNFCFISFQMIIFIFILFDSALSLAIKGMSHFFLADHLILTFIYSVIKKSVSPESFL